MRAAIYGRSATIEPEALRRLEDQLEQTRAYCTERGLTVIEEYMDRGVSGLSLFGARPEGSRLIADAREGGFDRLVIYAFDRLSRAAGELDRVYERMSSLGVTMQVVTAQAAIYLRVATEEQL